MSKHHLKHGTYTRRRTQVVYVDEHVCKQNMCAHHVHRPTALHTQNGATTPVEVADHIAVKFLGSGYFYQHDWLEQNGTRLTCGFFNRQRTGSFKSHFARVNFMI